MDMSLNVLFILQMTMNFKWTWKELQVNLKKVTLFLSINLKQLNSSVIISCKNNSPMQS